MYGNGMVGVNHNMGELEVGSSSYKQGSSGDVGVEAVGRWQME